MEGWSWSAVCDKAPCNKVQPCTLHMQIKPQQQGALLQLCTVHMQIERELVTRLVREQKTLAEKKMYY